MSVNFNNHDITTSGSLTALSGIFTTLQVDGGSVASYTAGSGLQLNGFAFDAKTATTSASGITILSNTINSDDNKALTPKAIYDAGYVDGMGTTNYIVKWSDSDTLTSGIMYDDGTNIGIGTPSPSSKLHVVGNATFSSSSGVPVTITNTGSDNSFVVNDLAGDATPFVVDGEGRVGVRGATPSGLHSLFNTLCVGAGGEAAQGITIFSQSVCTLAFGDTAAGDSADSARGYVSYSHTTDTLTIGTNNAARITVDSTGKVGVNRPSPASTLDVNGVITVAAGSAAAPALVASGDPNTGVFFPTGGDRFAISTDGLERLRINNLGNVGIGTNSPVSRLDVNGVITVSATAGSAGSYAPSLTISGDTNTGFGQVSGQSDSASIFTASHERLRVDSGGNVGIGHATPTDFNQLMNSPRLVVGNGSNSAGVTIYGGTSSSGSVAFADGTTTTDQYRGAISYSHSADALRFFAASAERARISSTGHLGVGSSTTFGPSSRLHVADSGASATAAVTIQGTATGTVASPASPSSLIFRNFQFDLSQANNRQLFRIDALSREQEVATGAAVFYCSNASGVATEYFRIDPHLNGVISALPVVAPATTGSASTYVVSFSISGDPNTGFGQVLGQSDSASVFTAGHERVRVRSDGNVGMGYAGASSHRFGISGNISGNGTNLIYLAAGTAQPSVTTLFSYYSQPSVAAGTTLALTHFNAVQGVIDGVVGSHWGFRCNNLEGSNVRGFISSISAGTNKFNFYSDGTAPNYFASNVGIGTTSPSYKLDVNGDIGLTNGGFYTSPTGTIIGTNGWIYQSGQIVNSQGSFVDDGDAQSSQYILRTSTTNNTWTPVKNNGSDAILLASNRTYSFSINIVGRRTNGQDNAGYKLEGVLYNDGYGADFVGSTTKTVLAESDSAWDVRVSISGAGAGGSDYLLTEVLGASSKNINWVAKVDLLEVGGDIEVDGYSYTELNTLSLDNSFIP